MGGGGTILHYDGVDWKEMNSGVISDLNAIWGTSPNDVFAVGWSGTFIHYDGNKWEEMVTPASSISFINDIYGFTSNNVYAIEGSSKGRIYHYDGVKWSEMTFGFDIQINAIWGTSPNDIYIVGYDALYHYNGIAWNEMTTEVGGRDIWGTASNDIYVATVGVGIFHYDGNKWSKNY